MDINKCIDINSWARGNKNLSIKDVGTSRKFFSMEETRMRYAGDDKHMGKYKKSNFFL